MDALLPERVTALSDVPHVPSQGQRRLWSKKIRAEKPPKGENNDWLNISSHNAS
jgi:hypothetical protein